MKTYNIDNLVRKSMKTVARYFMDRGYLVDSYEENTLEATFNHSGVCIRYAIAQFNDKGKCISAVMHDC